MFRQMDLRGQAQSTTQLDTVHQNTINTLRVHEEQGGVVKKFTSKSILPVYIAAEADVSQRVVLMVGLLCGLFEASSLAYERERERVYTYRH